MRLRYCLANNRLMQRPGSALSSNIQAKHTLFDADWIGWPLQPTAEKQCGRKWYAYLVYFAALPFEPGN
jgi:hypothetical protein